MEWDRRTFVKFAVGAALGLGASPVGPKLMDDVSIWTQNWSWVPKPDEGELAFANSINPDTKTGVRVRMINNRLKGMRFIRVEGDKDHPLSKGGVVAQDASALQLQYSDALRVKAPIWREPATGAPRQVTFEKAVSYVAGELNKLKNAGKAHTVAVIGNDYMTAESELLMQFATSYGSANLAFTPCAEDTWRLAGLLMLGRDDLGFDLDNAKYIVSFETPLFEGFGAPVATRKALASWRNGKDNAYFVQVETRASATAGKADTWLASKPGTAGAVALGICHYLVKNNAYDKNFAQNAFGFEDTDQGQGFKSLLLKEYTLEKVSEITGVPVKKLEAVAKGFAKSSKALAVCGPDNSGDPGRLYDFMAVLALNMLKGNLGKKGGIVARKALPLELIGQPIEVPNASRLDGGDRHPLGAGNLAALAEAAVKGDPYKPGAIIIVGTNPLFNGPQSETIRKMLDECPLVVAITPFMDETAQLADVVLPATTFLESWGDCATPYGSPVSFYGIHKPLISIEGKAKDAGDCILALAKAVGGKAAKALPFANMEEVLKKRTKSMGDFAKLAEKGYWIQDKVAEGALEVQTKSNGPEFFSLVLFELVTNFAGNPEKLGEVYEKLGLDPKLGATAFMPHYEKPAALNLVGKEYPLLMAGIPSLRTSTGCQPTSPYMVKILSDETLAHKDKLVVEINPATAHKLHINEDDSLIIESPSGSIKATAHLFAGACPDMVFVPMGLGHSAFGMYLKDKGDNFQKAVHVTLDATSGLPQWGLSPVRVKKAKGASHV